MEGAKNQSKLKDACKTQPPDLRGGGWGKTEPRNDPMITSQQGEDVQSKQKRRAPLRLGWNRVGAVLLAKQLQDPC